MQKYTEMITGINFFQKTYINTMPEHEKERIWVEFVFQKELSPKNNEEYKRQLARSFLEPKGVLNNPNIKIEI